MKAELLTSEELALINEKILPANKRSLGVFAGILLLFCLIMPFFPGKYTNTPSAYAQGKYMTCFLFMFIFLSALWFSIYYRDVICLKKDINDGEKLILNLALLRKNKIANSRYELVMEKPKKGIQRSIAK